MLALSSDIELASDIWCNALAHRKHLPVKYVPKDCFPRHPHCPKDGAIHHHSIPAELFWGM
eukprot:6380593-Pyramimonas_sp.AAC.1